MLGPDHQAAVLDDVRVAGQAGRDDADEGIDDQEGDQREDDDLDEPFERFLVLQPGWTPAHRGRGVDVRAHDPYTPDWPSLCASLFADNTSTVPMMPLIMPAAAVIPHCPPTMPLKYTYVSSTSPAAGPTALRWSRICSNPTVSTRPRRRMSSRMVTPRMPGMVTCHRRCQRLAPSTTAASYSAASMLSSAAR